MTAGEKLDKLCKGAQSIGPAVEIRLRPSEKEPGKWSVLLVVADATIIANTDFLEPGEAVDAALRKLASISSRMMAAVRQSQPPSGGGGSPSE